MSAEPTDLNAVLAWQLAAVEQHFIHVLTLKAWGDEESIRAIAAVDEVDLPNALRILDLMVSNGHLPDLGACRISPGASHGEIFAAERRIEAELSAALRAARSADPSSLIDPSLAPRDSYGSWLLAQSTKRRGSCGLPQTLTETGKSSLDRLFSHLLIVIEQSLIHAFVLWHDRARRQAEIAWDTSAAAMKQAADITSLLARRFLAPAPTASGVLTPSLAKTLEASREVDRALAEATCVAAERAEQALSDPDPELAAVCRASAATFRALSAWRPDRDPPALGAPCQGFARVRQGILGLE
ncbi:MAG: hypothetical protein AAF495_21290 [Pseudomonadota bacterium]